MRAYVHSEGRDGRDAWPSAAGEDSQFVGLDFSRPLDEHVATLAAVVPRDADVFAHSAGAVPVALALQSRTLTLRSLVLVEPALYDVARGNESVENHIAAITRARSLAATGDLFGYWSIVRPLMFGGPAESTRWDEERGGAARFEARRPPWGYGVQASAIDGVETLIVTGGWNAEYEAIASKLEYHGATRIRLPGRGHRPQDHPDFTAVVDGFLQVPGEAPHRHSST